MENAAIAYRLLAPRAFVLGDGDGDSLQNVNTAPLPNGALCWVNENSSLYRLDKFSAAASAPDAVIVPGSGPGRWVALIGSAMLSNARMSMFNPAELTVLIGEANVWQALPADINYAPQVPGAAFWSIAAGTGVATYSGPAQIYHFVAVLNVIILDEITDEVDVALTVNGEDIGTSDARGLSQRAQVVNNDYEVVTIANELALVPTDTVQLIIRNASGEDDLLLGGVQIIGIPVGVADLIT